MGVIFSWFVVIILFAAAAGCIQVWLPIRIWPHDPRWSIGIFMFPVVALIYCLIDWETAAAPVISGCLCLFAGLFLLGNLAF